MSADRTILVVEDEPLMRECLVEFLTADGFHTLEAGNVEEALVAFAEHPEIRLLFTDVSMPGKLDGCDLAEQIHAGRPDVKVIITSGKQLRQDCRLPKDGVFVPKPYSPTALSHTISKMLGLELAPLAAG
jgi:two-component system, response regulator PdtaR